MPGTLTASLIGAVVWTTGNAKRARAYFDMEPHLMDDVTMGEIAASLSTSAAWGAWLLSVPRFSFANPASRLPVRRPTEDNRHSVARAVRIVSAARCVICSGSGSPDSSRTNRGAYRHARGHTTTIIASTIVGSPVSTAAIYTTAINAAVINADTSSIICGGVS
jgi:hypothetical protein